MGRRHNLQDVELTIVLLLDEDGLTIAPLALDLDFPVVLHSVNNLKY
jgi:hypothetical protein